MKPRNVIAHSFSDFTTTNNLSKNHRKFYPKSRSLNSEISRKKFAFKCLLENFTLKSFSENKQKVENRKPKVAPKMESGKWNPKMFVVTLRAQVDVKLRAITAVS